MPGRHRVLTVVTVIALFAATLAPAAAQEEPAPSEPSTATSSPAATVISATRHDTSAPLRDMVRPLTETPEAVEPVEMPLLLPDQVMERARRRAQPIVEDPLRQEAPGQVATPDPIVNFEGQSDDDNDATPGAFRLVPPDTEGDVGPNHYVQMINIITEIYDKQGNSMLGPFANIDLFSGFGGACETENNGDPIALYDQFADRWMLSQFAIEQGIQCVAVSTTGDPTGSYHRYAFKVAPTGNDYPKMGVWPDGYYLTFNEFNASGDYVQAVACAFESDEMLQGNPAQQVCFGNPASGGDTFFSLQPAHLEGLTPPPEGTPNPFIMAFDDEVWGASPDPSQDFYKMWHFSVDWVTPANSTFTGPIDVPTEEFDAEFCNFSRNCIGQPGTATNLDVLGQFTMYRAVYRSFDDAHPDGAHQELWVNHSVDLDGDSLAGIRWTEIRSPATTPVLHQTGTWGPADGENR
ncbi:MAG: hypothetical protein GEU79_16210, partial [Acidimicrobiia bacterium]|nr:hypothetical protein [Acidimicrobiia bacterium]